LPEQDRTAKGRSIRNLIEGLQPEEEIRSVIATRNFDEGEYLLFATEQGKVKKTELSAYSRPRNSGLIATKLNDDDRLIGTRLVSAGDHVMIVTAGGQVVRFDEADARPMGRNAAGVKGARLKAGDKVVDLVAGNEDEYLLIACENGYGKRTRIGEFRLTKRGSQGVVGIKTNARNGPVVNARNASRCSDVLFSTASGMLVRTKAEDISIQGRATQGVRLVNLKADDKLIALAAIPHEQNEESADETATE
jgi:DNA gyrase subunit A